jgi:hypothetical protein
VSGSAADGYEEDGDGHATGRMDAQILAGAAGDPTEQLPVDKEGPPAANGQMG